MTRAMATMDDATFLKLLPRIEQMSMEDQETYFRGIDYTLSTEAVETALKYYNINAFVIHLSYLRPWTISLVESAIAAALRQRLFAHALEISSRALDRGINMGKDVKLMMVERILENSEEDAFHVFCSIKRYSSEDEIDSFRGKFSEKYAKILDEVMLAAV